MLQRMLGITTLLVLVPLYGQASAPSQTYMPQIIAESAPQVAALYEYMTSASVSKERSQNLLSQAEVIFADTEELDLPAVIVATLAMQYANEFEPHKVEQLYDNTKQQLRHYFLLRHYFFSCILPGRAKFDASIDAIRISQGAPQGFYDALLRFNQHEAKRDQGLVKIAQQKYGKVTPLTLYHALLYLELKQLTIKDGRIVALLLRNMALAHNQQRQYERELIVIRVIRELEIEGLLPVISSPRSVYSYLMVEAR